MLLDFKHATTGLPSAGKNGAAASTEPQHQSQNHDNDSIGDRARAMLKMFESADYCEKLQIREVASAAPIVPLVEESAFMEMHNSSVNE